MSVIPRVSIIMPAYNAARYIAAAIESILAQTYHNFELLVIDDGSTDDTGRIIKAFQDARLRYYRNQENLRLSATLNRGLGLARGTYIARMDADDLALPQRIALQVEYLDRHPEVDLVGTGMQRFEEGRLGLKASIPVTDPHLLRWRQHFSNQINHPTVMFRREVLQRLALRYGDVPEWAAGSPQTLATVGHLSEDYLLFGLIAMRGCVHNLPDALLRYRVHPASVSNSQLAAQLDMACQVSRVLFQYVTEGPVDAAATSACYFTRALSLSEATICAAQKLIDNAFAAHVQRYKMPAVSRRRIERDAVLRKRVLRAGRLSGVQSFMDFLRHPIIPRDAEEWRLAIRLCLNERAVDRLKAMRAEILGRLAAATRAN